MSEPSKQKKSPLVWIIVIILVVAGAVTIYLVVGNKEEKNTNTTTNTNVSTNTNTKSAADPHAVLMKYDGRVVNIVSTDGKVSGQLAMAYQPTEKMPLKAVYFLKVTDALPKEATSFSGESYYYVAKHAKAADIRTGTDTGVLSAILCNAEQTPDVLAMARAGGSIDVSNYTGCAAQNDPYASTTTFYQVYSEYYNQYTFDYDEIVGKDTLAVFNAAPYYSSTGTPSDRGVIVSQGEITKQYTLTYSE